MSDTVVFGGDQQLICQIDGDISLEQNSCGDAGVVFLNYENAYPEYTGAMIVTPSSERQVLQTEQKSVMADIVVEAIPSNYGLITWDGATLTVS